MTTWLVFLHAGENESDRQNRPSMAVVSKAPERDQQATTAALPVRRLPQRRPSARDIEFDSFEFQVLYFGREGPNYMPLQSEPSKGLQHVAKAELFGQEAIATVRYDLIDLQGRPLAVLHFRKTSHRLSDGEYVGLVHVPSEPFRVRASGRTLDGATFQQVFHQLFQPLDTPAVPFVVPDGFDGNESQKIREMLEAEDIKTRTELSKLIERGSDGVIHLPRVEVSNVTYQTFLATSGDPIGIRLGYELRFSSDGHFSPSPWVYPFYEDPRLRGRVEMQVFQEHIEPEPKIDYAHDRDQLLKYDVPARYKANTLYRVTVDLIPDWVIPNADRSRFCIFSRKFDLSPQAQEIWAAIRDREQPLRYRVHIRNTSFQGETGNFTPQKAFYNSVTALGAGDCGPTANINF
ncbi:MAG: hypothetical protein AB1898_27235 [Acidobacteriota bacterium]